MNVPDSMTSNLFNSCSNHPQIIISPPGSNQVWNYSILDTCSNQAPGLNTYYSASITTTPNYWDSANIAFGTGWVAYYQVNSNVYRELGSNYQNYTAYSYFGNPRDLLRFPVNYTDSFVDEFSEYSSAPTQSGSLYGADTVVADAWGTLITAAATIPNVMRVRDHRYSDGSILSSSGTQPVHNNYIIYTFYSPLYHDKLLEIQTDSTGLPIYLKYQDFLNPINKISFDSYFELSPNPSNGRFILINTRNENIEINIYNLEGKNTYSSVVETYQSEIDLTNESNGIYYCIIKDESNSILEKK